MAHKYKLKEIEIGDVKVDGGVKSVVTGKDPETGAISWSIDYVPNLTKLVEDSMELAATAKGVYQKAKGDKKFLDIYEQAKQLRNTIRTHVRNNYPEDYKKAIFEETNLSHHMQLGDDWGEVIFFLEKYGTSDQINDYISHCKKNNIDFEYAQDFIKDFNQWLDSKDIDEATGINGDVIDLNPSNKTKVGNYVKLPHHLVAALLDISDEIMGKEASTIGSQPQIKQALALLKKAAEKAMTGEKEVEEVSTSGAAGAYNTPYAFRKKGAKADDEAYKELGYKVVKEKALPVVRKKLAKIPKAKKVASKYRMKMPSGVVSSLGYTMGEGALGDGADLGPGPKAGSEGVTNNAYTKQFKYKLVPKNKDGTYVQKGAGMIVKKLY